MPLTHKHGKIGTRRYKQPAESHNDHCEAYLQRTLRLRKKLMEKGIKPRGMFVVKTELLEDKKKSYQLN